MGFINGEVPGEAAGLDADVVTEEEDAGGAGGFDAAIARAGHALMRNAQQAERHAGEPGGYDGIEGLIAAVIDNQDLDGGAGELRLNCSEAGWNLIRPVVGIDDDREQHGLSRRRHARFA